MDSRERTFMALNFEQPDRIPVDFWASRGLIRELESRLGVSKEAFLDDQDVDLRYIEGPTYVGPELKARSDGAQPDLWGVYRKTVRVRAAHGTETYKEVVESPLAGATSIEEINDYPGWPRADWFDYSPIKAQCERIRRQGRVVVFMGDRLNRLAQLKPAMYLRGVEQILVDMTESPTLADAIFSNIRRFYLAYAERIFDAADGQLDILLTGDDFGSQSGPLVSPQMWVQFLGQGFADYIKLAKSYGLRVMHHTCGSVRALIPLMLERGLDVLQSLQPEAWGMEAERLKAEFGERLAFHGGVSVQKTLPFGGLDDIRAEVKHLAEVLGPGGGYIFCTSHNIQADVPVENVVELFRAYRHYGRY